MQTNETTAAQATQDPASTPAEPEKSNRQIAAAAGVDHKTVGAAREELEAIGEIPQLESRVQKDGASYPSARKPSATVTRTVTEQVTADAGQVDDAGDMPNVIEALGALSTAAVLTEQGVGAIFHRCTRSVKEAVDRNELPRPTKVFGKNVWTAGCIIRHMENRLEAEARRFARNRA